VGPPGRASQEVRQDVPVLRGTLPGHQVQHHHTSQDALLHRQPHPTVRRHLLRNTPRLLHSGKLGREDNDGHHNPQLSQYLPPACRRDQPSHIPGHAPHRKVPPFYDGTRDVFDNRNRVRPEHSLPLSVHARHVAMDTRVISQRPAEAPTHATASTEARQLPEG